MSISDNEWYVLSKPPRIRSEGVPPFGSTNIDERYTDGPIQTLNYTTGFEGTYGGTVYVPDRRSYDCHTHFQYMLGYNHPGWRYRHRLPPGWDLGGPWTKLDIKLDSFGQDVDLGYNVAGNVNNVFRGPLFANVTTTNLLGHASLSTSAGKSWISGQVPAGPSDSDLNALGATAVSRVLPTAPAADLSVALGELIHDGLPSLPGRGEGAGNVGSEYLNMQFAWSPTISDGESFIKAIREHDTILRQFVRNSGRLVRRRYDYPVDRKVSVVVQDNASPGGFQLPTGQQVQLGKLTTTTRTVTKSWFSGAFTYTLPKSALGRTIAELDKVYGLVPGPSTAWNLTPWSWLVDWFSNAGDVMRNLDAFLTNGLIMPYGYIMSDIFEITESLWEGNARFNGTWKPLALSDYVVKRTRQRRQANPFGFGVSWDGLSVFQTSILAALGISRGHGPHQ